MRQSAGVSLLRRLRDFVDWDITSSATSSGSLSLLIGGLIAVVPAVFLSRSDSVASRLILALAILASAAWFGFFAWRFYRHVRAEAIRGDRRYDRQAKHLLAEEYADSESATRAGRRKKRKGSGA
jgi:hypothetical protein